MEAACRDEGRDSVGWDLTRILMAVTLVIFMASSGCQLLLLGGAAGAGAGAASYYMGRLEKRLPHGVPEAQAAAVSALKELGLPIMQDRGDKITAHVESEFADDKPVWIDIEAAGDGSSDVTIRVGYLGDRTRAMRILEAMEESLDGT